jgi:hypothetical protein
MSCVKQDFKGRIDRSHVGRICNQINPNWVDSSKSTRTVGRGKKTAICGVYATRRSY